MPEKKQGAMAAFEKKFSFLCHRGALMAAL